MFYQSLSSAMLSSQVFQLMAYMPFVSVVFHFFYAVSVTGYRVQYPHTQFEVKKERNILETFNVLISFSPSSLSLSLSLEQSEISAIQSVSVSAAG